MRHILIFIITFFAVLVSLGQTIKRQDNESIEAFVKRLMPDTTELAHQIIETNTWDTASTIISLYGYDDTSDINTGFNRIFGHLYVPTGRNNYRDITFGPIEEDGGYPEVISVFFANADNDKAKELLVLCKYDQRHYDYNGEFYETFIYDNPQQENYLESFDRLSEKFRGCECSWRDGKTSIAKYKMAKEIKAKLKQLDFK